MLIKKSYESVPEPDDAIHSKDVELTHYLDTILEFYYIEYYAGVVDSKSNSYQTESLENFKSLSQYFYNNNPVITLEITKEDYSIFKRNSDGSRSGEYNYRKNYFNAELINLNSNSLEFNLTLYSQYEYDYSNNNWFRQTENYLSIDFILTNNQFDSYSVTNYSYKDD